MDAGPTPGGRLTADDQKWLEGLVVELGPRLLAYVRRAYGLSNEAEDIVAETFCRAAGNLAALKASTRPELYLLTVTRNLCHDRYRRSHGQVICQDLAEQLANPSPDPAGRLSEHEQMQALREGVAALPESLREVVVLRLSTGLTFEQIAELLHIPLGTALSRMHTAVQRLRQALGCDDES